MSRSFLVPSHFGAPFLTTISNTKYDSRGRQMSFTESEVQRLERMAFVTGSKSRSNSPTLSPISSGASSPVPSRKLISEPYGDPIELMANRLAAELMFGMSDDFSSSSDEEQYVLYSTPLSTQRVPPPSRSSSSGRKAPGSTSTFQPGHRRKRSSLSAIPEED